MRSLSIILLLFFSFIHLPNQALAKGNPKYASIVMDADTGLILSQSRADKILHPASLTKMMTLLLTFEAIERGDIRLNNRLRISRHAASMVPSKLGLPAGATIRVEDAILALVTKSANDVAAALAEYLGGTESRFAQIMTRRAKDIGMSRTVFKNASGLHHRKQVSTARDMAKLGRYILLRYPSYYKYFSTKTFRYRGKTYRNHNRLMTSYAGMDGFKTGYISASGFNLVASAKRNGRRIIGVVFGGRTTKRRNDHMAVILNRGFSKLSKIRVARFDQIPLPSKKPNQAMPVSYTSIASIGSHRSVAPNSSQKHEKIQQPGSIYTAALQSGYFQKLIGEGDFDPAVSKRLETGLLAVAVHKGTYIPNPEPASFVENTIREAGHTVIAKMASNPVKQSVNQTAQLASINASQIKPAGGNPWAIQIGAYASRAKTDQAIYQGIKKLPASMSNVDPLIVPLRTAEGMLFRARIAGFTQDTARRACQYFAECLIIGPKAH